MGLLFIGKACFSQIDSTKQAATSKGKSPRKAMLFSAVVPGLGQVYNKKYWKVPIVYALMGTTLYLFDYNQKQYREYKFGYLDKTDKNPATLDPFPKLSEEDVITYMKTAKRYRDLNALLAVMFYAFNVADAYVDAHLSTFDVSDKLSMKVYPSFQMGYSSLPIGGVAVSFNF
jgi:hypothetical protein